MRATQTAQARVKAKMRSPAAQVRDIDFLGIDGLDLLRRQAYKGRTTIDKDNL